MAWEQELLDSVKETNRWLRILALPTLREKLASELNKPELRRIYQASDGRQIREVAASAKAGFGTVQRYWQAWAAQGLVEPAGVPGRFRKIIDLREVGLEE
jgi:transposase